MLRKIAWSMMLLPALAHAGARQDAGELAQLAEQFLLAQAANLPGTPSVKVNLPDSRLQLAHCDAPQAYLPNGAKAIGKTSVGIRCLAPVVWNVYLPASVTVATS